MTPVRITASAPTRIDLAGGTFDIWPLFLFHDRAQTINAALTLRASCTLTTRDDCRIVLRSDDTGETIESPSTSDLDLDRLPLVARLVHLFLHETGRGVDVTTRSDSPVGAGIAGSSAMNVALTGGLARFAERALTDDELLSIAMNVEAQVIKVPTGAQDYRPALYGGVSAVELHATGIRRVCLPVDAAALASRIVVAYTGASRNSGINNWDVMKRRIDGDPHVVQAFNGIRDAAVGMREALSTGDWDAAGRHLAAEWQWRKTLAPGVTTAGIDALLAAAEAAGALAGKVCGAGGGGCLFCLAPPERRDAVADALSSGGAQVLTCTISDAGLLVE
jgi:D-glycero-alpha-D-manno-heptose-7-phosphate kinase